MTTDLLVMPTAPPESPSSFKSDPGGSLTAAPSRPASPGLAKGTQHETFLNTLKKVCREQHAGGKSQPAASSGAERSGWLDGHAPTLPAINREPADDETLMDILSLPIDDTVFLNNENQLAAELRQLIALLEEFGLKDFSGARGLLSAADAAGTTMSEPVDSVRDYIAVFKQLLTAMPTDDSKADSIISAGLERLRHLIANAMAIAAPAQNPGDPKDGLMASQVAGSENAAGSDESAPGARGYARQPTALHPSVSRVADAGVNLPDVKDAVKPAVNGPHAPQPDMAAKADPVRPNPDMQAAVDGHRVISDARDPEMARGNVPVKAEEIEMARKEALADRIGNFNRAPESAGSAQRAGAQLPGDNVLAGENSPVSKLINDAQVEKDNPFKAAMATADDAGSRVVKLEAGANDTGQMTSQGHISERTSDTASLPKGAEAAPRELRNQTMEQLVRRAVIQVRDGQHEARIDLKPEFLGHVRMQVIIENQHVTVRIMTEFGFVKDMIENNIQQLKADLQQQGLDVDKLDVSVSRDAHGQKHQQQHAAQTGERQPRQKSPDPETARERQHEPPDDSPLKAGGMSTVDYFA